MRYQVLQDFSKIAQNAVKEALNARSCISQRVVEKLDERLKLIEGRRKMWGRLQKSCVEDFRHELAESKSPIASEGIGQG